MSTIEFKAVTYDIISTNGKSIEKAKACTEIYIDNELWVIITKEKRSNVYAKIEKHDLLIYDGNDVYVMAGNYCHQTLSMRLFAANSML